MARWTDRRKVHVSEKFILRASVIREDRRDVCVIGTCKNGSTAPKFVRPISSTVLNWNFRALMVSCHFVAEALLWPFGQSILYILKNLAECFSLLIQLVFSIVVEKHLQSLSFFVLYANFTALNPLFINFCLTWVIYIFSVFFYHLKKSRMFVTFPWRGSSSSVTRCFRSNTLL